MYYDTVARIADDLKKSDPNRKPSVRVVFARTGGDYNLVAEHMKTWRSQQPSGPVGAPPDLTAGLMKALRDEIAHHRGAAASDQARELEESREELEDLRREFALMASGKKEIEHQLAKLTSERDRVAAENAHQAARIEKLQEQLAAERSAAESARIDLAQTRLQTRGDAELVATLRADLEFRRAEVEAERAGRIESERRIAAADAALAAQHGRLAELLVRLQTIESERLAIQSDLDAERVLRATAERDRDVAQERAKASLARAEDLFERETILRTRLETKAIAARGRKLT